MIDLAQNIIYEDENVVAINKPSGLVVHPDRRTAEPSVSEWFVSQYPESRNVGDPLGGIERPGIVHRIDRETSGVLLLAKTKKGHSVLKEQFQKREIEKIYHLFIYGNLKDDGGAINLAIGRSASNFKQWSAQKEARGEKREALTYFQVLKRASDKSITFLEAKPKTGRTHQIRVHFKALQHPLVCDKLYGGRRSLGEGGCALGFSRLALHARAITFKTVSGETMTIEAPYPEDFRVAIDIMN